MLILAADHENATSATLLGEDEAIKLVLTARGVDDEGNTALHRVCTDGKLDSKYINDLVKKYGESQRNLPVETLNENQLTLRNDAGGTPLSLAAEHGHVKLVASLLKVIVGSQNRWSLH